MVASIRLALSQAFHNKTTLPPHGKAAFGDSFISQDIAPDNWIQHVTSGRAFTMGAYATNSRRKDTFVSSQMVGLDFDDNVSVADCLADEFIAQHAYLIYPTASSTPEKPKTRVMFILDSAVTGVQAWERLERGLLWQYQHMHPDDACKDAARLFFGSDVAGYVVLGHILPLAVLEAIAAAMEAENGKREAERTPEDNARVREQNLRNLADDKKKQRYYNYAALALDSRCSELSSMGADSGRNNALFKFGAAMGNMVAAGMIGFSECESALRGAAARSGLSAHEIDNTVTRAINHGMSSATDTDELDRKWQQKLDAWKAARQAAPVNVIDINEVYRQQKAELPQAVDSEPVTDDDLRELCEIVSDEDVKTAANNHLVYLDGYYMSWWQTQDIPLAFLSALLNLTNTRSSTALVLGKIHQAMMEGRLSWALFSVADVASATGLNRAMVKKAMTDLIRGGYVRFLKTSSIYSIVSLIKDSTLEIAHTLNQSIADYYRPVLDLNIIRENMLKMLDVFFRETYSSKGLAPRSVKMAEQIGIKDHADYSAWVKRGENARKDAETDEAARLLRREFEGDGHYWHGWAKALQTTYAIPVDWNSCETIKDVRGQLLNGWIAYRSVNTQDELGRILGCSAATLSSLMREQCIATIEQSTKEELSAGSFVNLETEMQRLQREKRGMIRMMKFKTKTEKGWNAVHLKPQKGQGKDFVHPAILYARNIENIETVWIEMITPSVQKHMTPEEIEAVYTIREKIAEVDTLVKQGDLSNEDKALIKKPLGRAKKAARAANMKLIPKMMDELDVILQQHGDTELLETETAPRPEKSTSVENSETEAKVVKSRNWHEHSPEFLHLELVKEVFMYTPHELVKEVIFDNDKNVVFKATGNWLLEIIRWLNQHSAKEPVRSMREYRGLEIEDYSDELKAEIKAVYERRQKALYDNLVPDFDMPDEKVIQMPLQETNPKHDDSTVSMSFIDRNGYKTEKRGNHWYVDGVKQHMTPELETWVESEYRKYQAQNRSVA